MALATSRMLIDGCICHTDAATGLAGGGRRGGAKGHTSAEECDLLGAFGCLTTHGDSLTRHMMTALFNILRDGPDGGVSQNGERCRNHKLFDDKDGFAKSVVSDALGQAPALPDPVCSGRVAVRSVEPAYDRTLSLGGMRADLT